MEKIIVPIRGMHCRSCEIIVEEEITKIPQVEKVDVSHTAGQAKIWFRGEQPSPETLSQAIEKAGYTMGNNSPQPFFSRNREDYKRLVNAIGILLLLLIVAKWSGLQNLSSAITGEKSLAMAGAIGLVAGFSSCMALIGGLVLGLSARHAEAHPEATPWQKFRPHIYFNLGRIIGFALLGGAVGLIGSALQPSVKFLSLLTIAVGLVMIFLGLKLVEIFPFLSNKSITLPKFISRTLGLHKKNKEYSHRGAFMSGALSFFLPCGFTQAMQLYAVSTGSFTQGALIMSLFALGTTPGLLGVGGLSSVFKGRAAKMFFVTAGVAVIMLGIFNISNASRLIFPRGGSVSPSDQLYTPAKNNINADQSIQLLQAEYAIDPGLYPKNFTVKAGQPVKMEVMVLEDDYGCMGSIMIPGLYQKPQFLEKGKTTVMEFTPTKKGSYRITCAMGLPHGTIIVQ